MTGITILLSLLIVVVAGAAWFYYRRTKRLLRRSQELMQRSVEDVFLRIENRLVHGMPEWIRNPDGKKTWAIVFTFDRKEIFARTVRSLRMHEPALPILVIDNGSTDGTRELLTELMRDKIINKVLLNRNEEVPQWQKSFAINQALRLLAIESPDYLVWLDDDLEITRPFIETAIELLEALRAEGVKVISLTDDEVEERNHPTLKTFCSELPSGPCDVKIRATFNGQFNFFSTTFFRELGPPPIGEGIRNFAGEDWYYSRRLQERDYRAAVFIAANHVGRGQSKREELEKLATS